MNSLDIDPCPASTLIDDNLHLLLSAMDEHRSDEDNSRMSPSPDAQNSATGANTAEGVQQSPRPSSNHSMSPRPASPIEDDRRRKRDREECSTPKGESDENKVLTGLTPLAKKGRVQPDSLGETGAEHEVASDSSDSPAADDDEPSGAPAAARRSQATPPPPSGLDLESAPNTPLVQNARPLPFKSEGRDTRHIRQRVEALEWDDSQGQAPAEVGEDVEITDVAENPSHATEKAISGEAKDVEVPPVTSKESSTAMKVDQSQDRDMDVAEVAAEVAVSAKELAKEDEKKEAQDVEIAGVAAEVGKTAAAIDKEPQVEGQVPSSTASTEVPEAVSAAPSVPSKEITSFTSYSSTASPFSAFSSSASPFSAVPPKAIPPPPAAQKPKAKTNFSGPPTSSLSTPVASRVLPPSTTPMVFGTPKATTSGSSSIPAPALSTPFSKTLAAPGTATTSPFAAFASSSGFSAVASSSSAFGSYSAQMASPFASIAKRAVSVEKEDETSSRKLGEPVEPDVAKREFKQIESAVTGEEGDDTLHAVKCKLFGMTAGQWTERGLGVLKLNISKDKHSVVRLVMRADATFRLLLNATLFPGFSMTIEQDKYVKFATIEDSGPVSYMLKLGSPPVAQELVKVVSTRVKEL
ncbi:Ran-binding protein 3, partial [Phenoliferia sp. Uapishka_3]